MYIYYYFTTVAPKHSVEEKYNQLYAESIAPRPPFLIYYIPNTYKTKVQESTKEL